jgi:periplasmic divalent cation tolerance protein
MALSETSPAHYIRCMGDTMAAIAVVTTVANREEARRMARALVERRLAACAQISEIESFYTWKGAVQNEPEFRVLFKTLERSYAEVERAIRELHSYELPAIHAFAFEHVLPAYGEWIEQSCHPEAEARGTFAGQ